MFPYKGFHRVTTTCLYHLLISLLIFSKPLYFESLLKKLILYRYIDLCRKIALIEKSNGPLVSSQEQRVLLVLQINRLSTGCQPVVNRSLCSSIGLHRVSLVRASERRSGDVSSMPWRIRGTFSFVSWANSSVGVPSCPVPPRRPAVRPDPTRPWYVRVFDSTSFPDMPCVRGAYKDKKSLGPLVSSKEQRALLVPMMNRLSTTCKPVVAFHRFT